MKNFNITNELDNVKKAIEESKKLTRELELIESQLQVMKWKEKNETFNNISREVWIEGVKKDLKVVKTKLKTIKKILSL